MGAETTSDSIVIIGAGIIGTSTAYYLSHKSSKPIHLIESSPEVFASASGYAAGFLARDWFSRPLSRLGALSFDLHKQLAQEHHGTEAWGYCPSIALSLEESVGEGGDDWLGEGLSRVRAAAKEQENSDEDRDADIPPWLKLSDPSKLDIISMGDTTAQVDPRRLCEFLLKECRAKGVQIHQPAEVISLSKTSAADTVYELEIARPTPQATQLPKETLHCNTVVIAAGAWSPKVFQKLFPKSKTKIPITSLAGHALLLKSSRWPLRPSFASFGSMNSPTSGDREKERSSSPLTSTCHALFTTSLSTSTSYSPELFSRFSIPPSSASNTVSSSSAPQQQGYVYLAGLNSPTYPLPSDPTKRVLDPDSVSALHATADHLLGRDTYEVIRESVCWRPVVSERRRGGAPLIGCLEKSVGQEGKGVWIAAGHGAWGISLSLGTGYALAESILRGKEMEEIKGLGL